jgi:signal transduction histidine kinase
MSPPPPSSGPWRYGVALLTTTLVTLLTLLLHPYLRHGVMVMFFASVMISAWIGGLGPGLVASVLAVLVSQFFLFPPVYSFAVANEDDRVQIFIFFVVTILVSGLTHKQKKTVGELTRSQKELQALTEALEIRVKERTAWLTLLYDVTRSANEAETLGQAFRFVAKRLCEEDLWIACNVFLPLRDAPGKMGLTPYSSSREGTPPADTSRRIGRGDGAAGRALESGAVEAGPDQVLAFPVLVDGKVRAVFECVARERLENSGNLARVMGAIGLELGHVTGRRQLQEEYAEAVWQQQVRIAHELHDSLGQELTGLGFLSKSLVRSLEGTPGAETAGKVRQGIEQSLQQIRGLARGVMPVEREPEGLMSALRQLTSTMESVHGIPCRFDCPQPVLVPDHQAASQIYRIAQEALTNAVKHGQASTVTVSLESGDRGILLRVADDGVGVPESSEQITAGSGLRIMRYRAAALGASLSIGRAVPRGTEVRCFLPNALAGSPAENLI